MKRRVHRLATDSEKTKCPNAHTFNRVTGRFHNLAGFEIGQGAQSGDSHGTPIVALGKVDAQVGAPEAYGT